MLIWKVMINSVGLIIELMTRKERDMKKSFYGPLLCVGFIFLAVPAVESAQPIDAQPSKNIGQPLASGGSSGSKSQKMSMFKFWKRLKKNSKKNEDPADSGKPAPKPARDIFVWFKTYAEVIGLVERKAFRSVDFSNFIQDSLKSAVQQVDAHSSFFAPDSFKQVMESATGEFGGIGVSVLTKSTDDDALAILEVIDGGPAAKAGLKGGDKIVEIEGEKLKGLSADEVVTKLKGKPGSKLSVKVLRDKKPKEFTITRDVIKDQTSMCFFFKDQGIYYLSLKIFAQNSAQQVSELLEKANDGQCKGVVLDLRRNPGGTLDSAIDVAGLFVPKKSLVVVTKDNKKQMISEYRTSTEPLLKSDRPIFILIDNFTASAAEILAGTLQHYSQKSMQTEDGTQQIMVFLVGVPTFGKGSVQEVIPISNGCALKLTTMLYYLPGDVSIQARGINPDFTIKPRFIPTEEMKWITEMYGKEVSLKNHITVDEVQKGRKDPVDDDDDELPIKKDKDQKKDKKKKEDEEEKSWEEKQKESLSQDVQVQASINMINLLAVARKYIPDQISSHEKALKFLKENYITDDSVAIEKVK